MLLFRQMLRFYFLTAPKKSPAAPTERRERGEKGSRPTGSFRFPRRHDNLELNIPGEDRITEPLTPDRITDLRQRVPGRLTARRRPGYTSQAGEKL